MMFKKRRFKEGDEVIYRGRKQKIKSLCLDNSPIGDYFLDGLCYAWDGELSLPSEHDEDYTYLKGMKILTQIHVGYDYENGFGKHVKIVKKTNGMYYGDDGLEYRANGTMFGRGSDFWLKFKIKG